jgi:hypothetical protein
VSSPEALPVSSFATAELLKSVLSLLVGLPYSSYATTVVVFLAGTVISFLEELVTELVPEVAVLSEPLVFLAAVGIGDYCVFL